MTAPAMTTAQAASAVIRRSWAATATRRILAILSAWRGAASMPPAIAVGYRVHRRADPPVAIGAVAL